MQILLLCKVADALGAVKQGDATTKYLGSSRGIENANESLDAYTVVVRTRWCMKSTLR